MTEHDMDPAELVEKALLVKNLDSLVAALQISESELPDKLTIHFQRKSNYGGDVQEVIYPLNFFKKDAIVIFADAKDMLSAAQHEHVFRLQHEQMFKSHPLTVTRLPPVFTSVEAKIDPLYFNIMPFDAPAEFSKRVEKHSNVKVDKTNIGKITCSHPSQLKFVEREVCGLVMNPTKESVSSEDDGFEAAGASNFGFESSHVQRGLKKQGYDEDDEMEVTDQNEERRNTGRFSEQSDEPKMFSGDHTTSQMHLDSREEHGDKSGKNHSLSGLNSVAFKETDVDNVGRFKTMDNLVVLDKSTYEYLVKFEDTACSKLFIRNKAQIQVVPGHDNDLEGFIFPSNTTKTSAENVSKAKEEFISLYQKLHFEIARKTIDCSSADATSIGKATEETLRQFKADTLITKVDGYPNLRLILRRGDVEEVARQFRKIAGIKSGKTLRNTGADVHGTYATSSGINKGTRFGKYNPEVQSPDDQQNRQSSHNPRLQSRSLNEDTVFTTNEGMHIAIRTGDITKLGAHAVVCPSDQHLKNEVGGVAKAILDAAGVQLRGYCQKIMTGRNYHLLKMAECIVTPGFNLKYKAVIHVCGPTDPSHRHFESDLHCSFLNCLRSAERSNMSSLAMPLIASGAIGAAKTLCADVLAQALINFSRESGGSKFVKEVFLVNIDQYSSTAIQQSLQTAFSLLDDATLKARHVGGSDRSAAVGSGVSQSTYVDGRKPTRVDLDTCQMSSGSHPSAPDDGCDKRLKQGDSTRQVEKERHVINMNPQNQHLAAGDWPTPGESKDQIMKNQKNPLGGNAANDESYGNRRESHNVNPADKSVGSTGGQSGPLDAKTRAESADDQKDECPICLADKTIDTVVLRCKHRFCKTCIDQALKNSYRCPVCQAVCSQPRGNQPKGTMKHTAERYLHLPGYEKDGVITIDYYIPGGIQSTDHPNPGKHFSGTSRTAYLPDNQEGRGLLGLLRKAFDAGLVFTVGQSVTSGLGDTVTWNDIHHKTSMSGGPQNYGYPDPDYMKRVKEDLAAKGIQ